MTSTKILLILVSGLGVIHGVFLAAFLWNYSKGNTSSNKILSLLLIVLSFRVGKSVLLEFSKDTDVKLIFIGLAMLMVIGPLFYLYTLSSTNKAFHIKAKKHLLHFVPALLGVCFGIWVKEPWLKTQTQTLFIILFAVYYTHYLVYLVMSYLALRKAYHHGLTPATYTLIRLLFFALLAIWAVYVLNLFEEVVPYVLGPILYSLIAYFVSFIVIRKGYIAAGDHVKYKTTSASDAQVDTLYDEVVTLMTDQKAFKKADLTLKSLSDELKVSTQVLSMVINQKSETNFNGFINAYRIEESINLFQDPQFDNRTIASIAFDVGFNSISSFNTAFKKHTEKTPLTYRKALSK